MRRIASSTIGLLLVASALSAPLYAHAALGHGADSVRADRLHLTAQMQTTGGAYTTQTLTLANGGVVKEFSSNGTVFAVAWRGPGRPDLRQLLGEHFETLQADNANPRGRRLHRAMTVNRTDLVVHSAGHPGAFWGSAYLPGQLPAGVTAAGLR